MCERIRLWRLQNDLFFPSLTDDCIASELRNFSIRQIVHVEHTFVGIEFIKNGLFIKRQDLLN